MSANKGSLVLIKVGDGATPTEGFTTVGGLRTSRLVLNNQAVDTTNKDSGAWRQLLSGAGVRAVGISGTGVFTDAASEETLRGYAFAGTVNNFRFYFANGDYVSGPFHISAYERSGNYNNEETYAISLESAGTVSFTAA